MARGQEGLGAVEAQERGLNPNQTGPERELPLSSRAHRLISKPLPVKAGSRRVVLLPALKAQMMLSSQEKKKEVGRKEEEAGCKKDQKARKW